VTGDPETRDLAADQGHPRQGVGCVEQLAEAFIADSLAAHRINRDQLTLHADRGPPEPVAGC
jgi:hypothetical protein